MRLAPLINCAINRAISRTIPHRLTPLGRSPVGQTLDQHHYLTSRVRLTEKVKTVSSTPFSSRGPTFSISFSSK